MSFSTASRFFWSSAGPSESSKREVASRFLSVGISSPALATFSRLLRSSSRSESRRAAPGRVARRFVRKAVQSERKAAAPRPAQQACVDRRPAVPGALRRDDLPVALPYLLRLAEKASGEELPPEVRLRAGLLRGGIEDFSNRVASKALLDLGAAPTEKVLRAYADDHLQPPGEDPGRRRRS